MSEFVVKTEKFEGPVELLLEMIETRKLPINDISLSEVADDFLNYLKEGGILSLEETANFVVVASTLLLIKSASLLPGFQLTAEEEENVSDLKRRLAIYQIIKELAGQIKASYGRAGIFFREDSPGERISVFSPSDDLTVANLAASLQFLIADLPKKETRPEATVKKVISLEEMIERLTERIKKNLQLKFSELTGQKSEEKITIIVSFLALLELIKRGIVATRQQGHFNEIEIKSVS